MVEPEGLDLVPVATGLLWMFLMMGACPICRKAVPLDVAAQDPASRFRPFCSERCKRIDLGAWLDGRYRISQPVAEEDLDGGALPVEDSAEDPELN